jgi:hypothetical protein
MAFVALSVPAEFRGRARAFRARIAAVDDDARQAATRIARAVREPLARGKIAQPADLQRAARRCGRNCLQSDG